MPSRGDIKKALQVLKRAGKGNAPLPGDELPAKRQRRQRRARVQAWTGAVGVRGCSQEAAHLERFSSQSNPKMVLDGVLADRSVTWLGSKHKSVATSNSAWAAASGTTSIRGWCSARDRTSPCGPFQTSFRSVSTRTGGYRHVFMYLARSPSPMDFQVFVLRHSASYSTPSSFSTVESCSRGRSQSRWRSYGKAGLD